MPNDIMAVNFNLYEGVKQTYDIEFVGCSTFDANDNKRIYCFQHLNYHIQVWLLESAWN